MTSNKAEVYIPYATIPAHLELRKDDCLWVASDLSRMALNALKNEKAFDPMNLVEGFLSVVSEGTLLVPAFVNAPALDTAAGIKRFDLLHTAPQTGVLANGVFKAGNFKRTHDPFHSFFVFGKDAETFTEIETNSTFGADSVFALVHKKQGKLLLIDVDLQHGFTFAHFVEEAEQVSYRNHRTYAVECIDQSGVTTSKTVKFYEKKKGIGTCLNKLTALFIKSEVITEKKLNGSTFTLIDLDKAYDLIKADIRTNGGAHLHFWNFKLWVKDWVKDYVRY